jgi:hypothetical protein
MYADFYKAGKSSWCNDDIVDDHDYFDHYVIIVIKINL